ncbi:WD40 repeat domain-containing protein, partial [Sulfurimonas sp.]|uniref:WD40 repeat domain-containing protein n=1 Tax=Sulfurimonas sp. TaxID=2022749 RepID=UPI002605D240
MDDLAQYNAIFKLIDFTLLQTHLTAFSLEKELLAIANDETIYIYDTKTKNQLYRIKSHDGAINKLFFLPDSQHILTATSSGRVIIYNYKDARYNVRIFSWIKKYKTQLPTRMSAFAFKRELLAIGTSDGKVRLINLGSYSIVKEINATNAAIATLCFTDTEKLIIADAHGEIFIYDLQKLDKLQSVVTHLSYTKQLLHIPKSDFLLIHSNQDFITLFNLKTHKIVRNEYLKFHTNISHMAMSKEGNLLVVLENREILHITLQNEKNLKSLLLHNMMHEAYALVANNPQLLDSKEYKKLEKIYKIKYLNAVNTLQHSDTKKAQHILENCSKIQSKKEDIELLFEAYRYYERFQTLCMQKLYAPAYALSEKYPPLQYSKEYKEMEKGYKRAYKNAQKQILLMDTQKAKELLLPYLGVVLKKESINLILKDNKDFLSFLDALKQLQYHDIKKLLALHPNFSQLPPYKAFLAKLDATLSNINSALNAAAIQKATEMMQSIKGISLIKAELKFLEHKAEVIEILMQSYQESEFKKCYEIIDEYPQMFVELKLAKMLEKHWSKLMQKCEKYALYGNIKGVKKTLKELISVKSRTKRVGELLRLTFIVAIDDFISQKKFNSAENFIYSYIDIFGLDSNLQRVMKEY